MTHRGAMPLLAALAAALVTSAAGEARAQQGAYYPFGVQIGGGGVAPAGEARGASGLGWDVSVAGDLEFRPGLAIRADYLYGRFAAKEVVLPAGGAGAPLRAKSQVHVGTLDLVWRHSRSDESAAFYVLGGPLYALRRVTLTGEGGGPLAEVELSPCRPQWLQCASSPMPYHRVLGIRRSYDFGLNVGAGVNFDVGLNARVFAEARLVFIDGPSFRDASGSSRSSDAFYVPVVAGIRFQR